MPTTKKRSAEQPAAEPSTLAEKALATSIDTDPGHPLPESSTGHDKDAANEGTADDLVETEGQERIQGAVALAGAELIDFYGRQSRAGVDHAEIARQAGYVSRTAKGGERVMLARFNSALLAAQNYNVGSPKRGKGSPHAGKTQARVTGTGTLLVSQLAVAEIGGREGDVYAIEYPGDGCLLLKPTGDNRPVKPRRAASASGGAEQPGASIPGLDAAAGAEAA